MAARTLKALLLAGVLSAGVAAGLALAGRPGTPPHRLDLVARQTADAVTRRFAESPWVPVSAQAAQRDDVIEHLEFVVRARDGGGADLAGLVATVRTGGARLVLPSEAADAATLTPLRDVDHSVARGHVDPQDLAILRIPLASLGDPLVPRSGFTVTLDDGVGPPLVRSFDLPAHFEGRYVGLDLGPGA